MKSNPASYLHIALFGTPELHLSSNLDQGDAISIMGSFVSTRAQALLYFLVCEPSLHTRSSLAVLLWPGESEERARTNLRTVLSNLRKVVGKWLVIDRQTVQFNKEVPHFCDVARFREILSDSDATEEQLEEAIALYQGFFLDKLVLRGDSLIDEWISLEREQLRSQFVQALEGLSRYQLHSQPDKALQALERILEIDPLNEAAHRRMMQALAATGRNQAALTQFTKCAEIFNRELGMPPSAETVSLEENLRKKINTVQHNLPVYGTSFVGRRENLATTLGHLTNPDCRLINIVGIGGMGKTRLAIEAAHATIQEKQSSDVYEGVYFIRLSQVQSAPNAVTERAAIIRHLADVLGLSSQKSAPIEDFIASLRTKYFLLILDQAEHLTTLGGVLTELLHGTLHLKVMVTSQFRLLVSEEWVVQLHGLGYPTSKNWPLLWIDVEPGSVWRSSSVGHDSEDQHAPEWPSDSGSERRNIDKRSSDRGSEPDGLKNYDSIQLFLRCAEQQLTSLTLSSADQNHVIEICQKLDGLPLAIELTASWLPALSIAEIAQRLSQDLSLLTTLKPSTSAANDRGKPDQTPDITRNIEAIFAASWKQLTEHEQKIVQRLSIFRNPFTRAAAENLGQASLPDLVQLVNKSFLSRSDQERFQLHAALNHYIQTKQPLPANEDRESREEHSVYFLNWLASKARKLTSTNAVEAVGEVEQEWQNIELAWQWQLQNQGTHYVYISLKSLHEFFLLKGSYHLAREMWSAALEAFKSPSALRARLLLYDAGYQAFQGDYEASQEKVYLVRKILDQVQDQECLTFSYVTEAMNLRHTNQLSAAEQCLEKAVALTREVLSKEIIPWAAACYAWAQYTVCVIAITKLERLPLEDHAERKRLYDMSRQTLDNSMQISYQTGYLLHNGWLISIYGQLETAMGNYDVAEKYLDEAQIILENADHPLQIENLQARASLATLRGQYALAAHLLKITLSKAQRAPDHPRTSITTLITIGTLLLHSGKTIAAAQLMSLLIGQSGLTDRHKREVVNGLEATKTALNSVTYHLTENRGRIMTIDIAIQRSFGWLSEESE